MDNNDFRAQAKTMIENVLPLIESVLIKHWAAALSGLHAEYMPMLRVVETAQLYRAAQPGVQSRKCLQQMCEALDAYEGVSTPSDPGTEQVNK